ncbi:MAG: APC family permease [Actinobacteria bacterium]|nr:APC family permease [Actinomycetota bacterium]MBI3685936.1 APC family permease [Actinomycetota bacterium]
MTASATAPERTPGHPAGEKGLKSGALGLLSGIVIGVASTAPAYSLAATLALVVGVVGLQAPSVVVLAFVPMLFVAIGYQQLNKVEPDCGTTFTWATRAFGPKMGWLGGWGVVAADVLVMSSLAQVAGQYFFLLFDAKGIGTDATSPWVLLVGVIWIVLMTYICFRGIEVSARFQKVLLSIEVVMLVVLAVTALVRVYGGGPPAGSVHPSLSWFNPLHIGSVTEFAGGVLLMLFIYWGWDTAVAVNEETANRTRTPGIAAVVSTVLLLATYVVVTVAALSFAGIGDSGIGLNNPEHSADVLSVLGNAVFGDSGIGTVLSRLLILMVLSSAAASTQTTILPTARTTLSMAVHKALPAAFARIHHRHLTPATSTIAMGTISAVLYAALNFVSSGNIIGDSVSALGMMIAFYYDLTGFACAWYFRHQLGNSLKDLMLKGVLPALGGVMLLLALTRSIYDDWDPVNSNTSWTVPFPPHWQVGGVFVLGVGTAILGVVLMFLWKAMAPGFFNGETLTRGTPVPVPVTSDGPPVGGIATNPPAEAAGEPV